jgi:hypothetical protein
MFTSPRQDITAPVFAGPSPRDPRSSGLYAVVVLRGCQPETGLALGGLAA